MRPPTELFNYLFYMPNVKTGGKIYDQSNVANATTTYVYFGLTAHQARQWALQWDLSNVTLTLEFTNERLASADINDATTTQLEALTWEDQTNARTGAATQTTDGSYTNDEHEAWWIGRAKLVTTNATNHAKLYFGAQRRP